MYKVYEGTLSTRSKNERKTAQEDITKILKFSLSIIPFYISNASMAILPSILRDTYTYVHIPLFPLALS